MDDSSGGLIPAAPSPALDAQPPPDRRRLGRILLHIVTDAEVQRLPPPEVPPDLAAMPLPQRICECLRLAAEDAEHSLSPHGHVRSVLKLACRIAIVLGVLLIVAGGLLVLTSLVFAIALVVAGQLVAFLTLLLKAALLLVVLLAIGLGLLWVVGMVTRR